MDDIRVSRDIAADADRVWAVITDLDSAAQTLSAVTRIERLDSNPGFGVGTRWRETRVLFGREATEEMAVIAVEPGRSYTVEADSRGARYRSQMVVDPLTDASSRLFTTMGSEADGVVTRLLANTVGRLLQPTTRKALQRDLDDIAAAAEARA